MEEGMEFLSPDYNLEAQGYNLEKDN
jgi:hypothetical protein